jgi:hypothetical protein
MTGAEHYAEAESLLTMADRDVSDNLAVSTGEHKADILAAAQVHATLALAYAHGLRVRGRGSRVMWP